MCGILAILGLPCPGQKYRIKALACSKKQRHRGPDNTGVYTHKNSIFIHERLALVDPYSGDQPFVYGNHVSVSNGEIYNHEHLRQKHFPQDYPFIGHCDCEVLIHLYLKYGENFLSETEVVGMFAFVNYNEQTGEFIAARDPIGIIPLYVGYGKDGSMWFSSELKVLQDHCDSFKCFPPGHVYKSSTNKFERFYNPNYFDLKYVPTRPVDLTLLRENFIASVRSHLMSDAPFGVLLSGGLDSSLVASVAIKELRKKNKHELFHSFCIGLKGSPDLAAAQRVADLIGTTHHGFEFTVEEGLDAIRDVIYHLETFDVTTIRASTPMYLMARKIKALGFKMVLSGEGSDEMMAGYLYFHKAPNKEELHEETIRKIGELHTFDCLRANKSMLAWGVEVRVPFLDRKFMEYAMDIDPVCKLSGLKNRMEKWALRSAFDCNDQNGEPYLPSEILWRQKEQFSDGVGYNWIDSLKQVADQLITDRQMETAKYRFPISAPKTKEAYMFREIFAEHFPSEAAARTVPYGDSVACSTAAAIKWDKSFSQMADPSGRAVKGIHNKAYNDAQRSYSNINSTGADVTQNKTNKNQQPTQLPKQQQQQPSDDCTIM